MMRKFVVFIILMLLISMISMANTLNFVPADANIVIHYEDGERIWNAIQDIPIVEFLLEDLGVESIIGANIQEMTNGGDPEMYYNLLRYDLTLWGKTGNVCVIGRTKDIEETLSNTLSNDADKVIDYNGAKFYYIGELIAGTIKDYFMLASSEETLIEAIDTFNSSKNIFDNPYFKECYDEFQDKPAYIYTMVEMIETKENIEEGKELLNTFNSLLKNIGGSYIKGYLDVDKKNKNIVIHFNIKHNPKEEYKTYVDNIMNLLLTPKDYLTDYPAFEGFAFTVSSKNAKALWENVKLLMKDDGDFQEAIKKANEELQAYGMDVEKVVVNLKGELIIGSDFTKTDEDGNSLGAIIVPMNNSLIEQILKSKEYVEEDEYKIGDGFVITNDKVIFTNVEDGVKEISQSGKKIKNIKSYNYLRSFGHPESYGIGFVDLGGLIYENFSVDTYETSGILLEAYSEDGIGINIIIH